jgi:hypothetical protein
MRSIQLIVRACLLSVIIVGCTTPVGKKTREIVKMSHEQREVALSKLTGEEQIEIYLYAYNRMEPPVILAGEMASNWPSTLPVIAKRLKTEESETSLVGLMMILSTISSHFCSLETNNGVLASASYAVTKIRPPYRELADQQLKEMKEPNRQLPQCR